MTYHLFTKTLCLGLAMGLIVAILIGAITAKKLHHDKFHEACEAGVAVLDGNGNHLCPVRKP